MGDASNIQRNKATLRAAPPVPPRPSKNLGSDIGESNTDSTYETPVPAYKVPDKANKAQEPVYAAGSLPFTSKNQDQNPYQDLQGQRQQYGGINYGSGVVDENGYQGLTADREKSAELDPAYAEVREPPAYAEVGEPPAYEEVEKQEPTYAEANNSIYESPDAPKLPPRSSGLKNLGLNVGESNTDSTYEIPVPAYAEVGEPIYAEVREPPAYAEVGEPLYESVYDNKPSGAAPPLPPSNYNNKPLEATAEPQKATSLFSRVGILFSSIRDSFRGKPSLEEPASNKADSVEKTGFLSRVGLLFSSFSGKKSSPKEAEPTYETPVAAGNKFSEEKEEDNYVSTEEVTRLMEEYRAKKAGYEVPSDLLEDHTYETPTPVAAGKESIEQEGIYVTQENIQQRDPQLAKTSDKKEPQQQKDSKENQSSSTEEEKSSTFWRDKHPSRKGSSKTSQQQSSQDNVSKGGRS